MNKIKNINFYDFSFNGTKLSEMGGIIGGSEPLTAYPLLPSRSYVTDRAIGQDGQTVFQSYLEPRTFEIPVFFEDIDTVGIRKIAMWLNTPQPQWFNFDGDDLRIKCSLDSNGTALETITGENGQAELKFIAHDPYYYELSPQEFSYTELSGNEFSYEYIGCEQSISYPTIELYGADTFTVSVYDGTDVQLTTCTISDVKAGVIINSMSGDVLSPSGASLYNEFSGDFPYIPQNSDYKIVITGKATRIKIIPNYRWV